MTQPVDKPIKDLNEVELYFFIEECGAFIWRMNHMMGRGDIPQAEHPGIEKDVEKVRGRQKEAFAELSRIGIVAADDAGKPTEEYWTWYHKWHDWHHNMPDDAWRRTEASIASGISAEQVEQFRKEAEAMTNEHSG